MTEIWKDIKDFEDCYQISNLGRIKSKARKINRFSTRWEKDASYMVSERIIEGHATRNGYLFIALHKDGENFPKRVHRIVAEAFCEGYSEECDVHHIDGDITNNRADNLKCLSTNEHHEKHPHNKAVIGEKDGKTLYFEKIALVEKMNFDPANVSRCCKCAELPEGDPRKSKYATHKGWKWRYEVN